MDTFIRKGWSVTVINPSPFLYYSGMGPGMLSGLYSPEQIRFNVREMVETRGGTFIADRAVRIVPQSKTVLLGGGGRCGYDIASCNVGSVMRQTFSGSGMEVFNVKPIENLLQVKNRIMRFNHARQITIVVAGGGSAGVEIAGNLWKLTNETGRPASVTLITDCGILDQHHRKARALALRSLDERGIRSIENMKIHGTSAGMLRLSNGESLPCDIFINATGIRPPALFRDSGLPTGDNDGLIVDDYLRSVAHPDILGGGDCISFRPRALPAVGVYAVRQGMTLFRNIHARIDGADPSPFKPRKRFLSILNLGDGTGIYIRGRMIFRGRLAFILKNHIDTSFMKKYRTSGNAGRTETISQNGGSG